MPNKREASFTAAWGELIAVYSAASWLSVTSIMCSGEVWHSVPEVVIGGALGGYFGLKALHAAASGLGVWWEGRKKEKQEAEA